jgi:hypothetical protein
MLVLKRAKNFLHILGRELFNGLASPAGEYVIGVVMVVVLTVVVVVIMVVLVVAALIVIVIVVAALAVVVIVVMLVVAALTVVVIVVVLVVAALTVIVVVVMLVVATLIVVVIVVMLVVVMVMSANRADLLALHKASKLLLDRVTSLHSPEQLLGVKLCNRSRHENCAFVMLPDKRYRLLELLFRGFIGMAENDTARVFYLIPEKLTKVFQIHFALVYVGNDRKAIELYILCRRISDRSDNVGKLANARRLDYNAIRRVFVYNLSECLAEISNERAADTSRIHLGYIDARILEKSAVYAYLSKLVFDKHQPLSLVRFLYELISLLQNTVVALQSREVQGLGRADGNIKKLPALRRSVLDEGQMLRAKEHRAKGADKL